MDQPVPNVDRSDVERVVQRDFKFEDRAKALELLEQYGSDHGSRHRVHLAALKLSSGDLARLREWVTTATNDFRDVLAAAEYPLAFTRWSSLNKSSDAERQAVYEADWQQYQLWLHRTGTLPDGER